MMSTLGDAQAVALLSWYKPLVMFAVLAGWASIAGKLDKDLLRHYLPRGLWNGIQVGVAAAAFAVWLLMPTGWGFWIGLPLALVILGAGLLAYAGYRNSKVAADFRWTLSWDTISGKLAEREDARAQRAAKVVFVEADGRRIDVPVGRDVHVPAHALLQEVMEFALPRHAERLDLLVAGGTSARLVVQVDGVAYPRPDPEGKAALALIDYVKERAGLDLTDRRRKQLGQVRIDAGEHGQHRLGVVAAGSTREMTLSLRIDPNRQLLLKLDKMGLSEGQRQQLLPVFAARRGLVLVAAPAHQGLSTTLYSFLAQHDPYTQSVVTLEEEIATELEGVNQNVLEPGLDAPAMNQKLVLLLRQDPQVLMVGRVADAGMARTLASAAGESRLYAGLRQEDTFAALRTWIKAVGDPAKAVQHLSAVVGVRLVRKLCTTCRMGYKPDPEALRKLNLPADKVSQLFKQSGQVAVKGKPQECPDCLGMAYRGRTGVYEVMVLDDTARKLMAGGTPESLDQLRAHLRKNRMLYLQEAGLFKVAEGATSIGELRRALAQDKEPEKK